MGMWNRNAKWEKGMRNEKWECEMRNEIVKWEKWLLGHHIKHVQRMVGGMFATQNKGYWSVTVTRPFLLAKGRQRQTSFEHNWDLTACAAFLRGRLRGQSVLAVERHSSNAHLRGWRINRNYVGGTRNKDFYQKEQKQISIKRFLKRNLVHVGMAQCINALADKVYKNKKCHCTQWYALHAWPHYYPYISSNNSACQLVCHCYHCVQWHFLFLYFVSQYIHALSHPTWARFLFKNFLWRL